MREILFRGKRKSYGEWVEGYYTKHIDARNCEWVTISRKEATANYRYSVDRSYIEYEVYPETVGQYTGLKDKNGKKIFEGDIVKITDTIVDFETTAYIGFGNPNALYNWGWQLVPLQKKPFAVDILHWVEMEESGAFIEVIGNIHDNPELIKEVNNND